MPAADTVVDEKSAAAQATCNPGGAASREAVRSRHIPRTTHGVGLAASRFTPFITAACTLPWALVEHATPWTFLGRVFLLSTALTWALLLVSRLPLRNLRTRGPPRGSSGHGPGCGRAGIWLDGWSMPTGTGNATTRDMVLLTNHRISPDTLSTG